MQSALNLLGSLDKFKDSDYIYAIFVELSNRLTFQSCSLSIPLLKSLLILSPILSLNLHKEGDWLHSSILPILWQHSNTITIDDYYTNNQKNFNGINSNNYANNSNNSNNEINNLLIILLFKIYSEFNAIEESIQDLFERLKNKPTITTIIIYYNCIYKLKTRKELWNSKSINNDNNSPNLNNDSNDNSDNNDNIEKEIELYQDQFIKTLLPLVLLPEFRDLVIYCFCHLLDMNKNHIHDDKNNNEISQESSLSIYQNFERIIKARRLDSNNENLSILIISKEEFE